MKKDLLITPTWALVLATLVLALAVRVPMFVGSDFPLNDGGMFCAMAEDLGKNDLRLPVFTSYNGGQIPFAYPPFGLYVAAICAAVTGVPLPPFLRFLPLLANLATVVVMVFASRAMLQNRGAAILAALLVPLLPPVCDWLIMGGGLTRSFGVLFATLTAWFAHRAFSSGNRRDLALSGVAVALTVLSHPAAAVFALMTPAAFCALLAPRRAGVARLASIYGLAGLLTAPWWASVLAHHGIGPFLAAASSPDPTKPLETLKSFFILRAAGSTVEGVVGVLAIIGFFRCVARRRWLFPVWLLLTCATLPNLMAPLLAFIVAMLAGVALGELILPALAGQTPTAAEATAEIEAMTHAGRRPGWPVALASLGRVGIVVFVLGNAASWFWSRDALGFKTLQVLSPKEREAMAWVGTRTPPGSSFLVLSRAISWAEDPASEWFPVLANRNSAATPQGLEWVPGREFLRRDHLYKRLKDCFGRDVACVEETAQRGGAAFAYVYVSKQIDGPFNPEPLWRSFVHSNRFRVVFDGPGATVFARQVS